MRAIGASNFDAAQIEEADAVAREHGLTPFCAVQNEYSLLVREAEDDALPGLRAARHRIRPLLPAGLRAADRQVPPGEAGPAGARLSDRDADRHPRRSSSSIEALQRYADERGVSLLDVAIGALLAHETVSSVIAGATKPEQVRANAAAARWTPSDEDLDALRDILSAHAV